jgi:hypothetical protein
MWTEFVLLRMGLSGRLLCARYCTFGFHNRLVIYCLTERLLGLHGLYCIEFLIKCSVSTAECICMNIFVLVYLYVTKF